MWQSRSHIGRSRVRKNGLPRQHRHGLSLFELIVAMAILAMLFGIALPAIQSVRESARRMQCANNLRQIGTSLFTYHDSFGSFPPGWMEHGESASGWGWASSILPQIGQGALAKEAHFEFPIGDHRNDAVRLERLALFVCPSDLATDRFWLYKDNELGGDDHAAASMSRMPSKEDRLFELATANYVGVFGTSDPDEVSETAGTGAFLGDCAMRIANFVDGLSQSFLVAERTSSQLPSTWVGMHPEGEEGPTRVVGCANLGMNNHQADECEFSSRHPHGAQFLMGDGRVVFLSEGIDRSTYRSMAARSDRLIANETGATQ